MQLEVQFVRVEAFRFNDMARIVGEASRVPEYCRHVERPEEPTWVLGSAERVVTLANAIMAIPCTYTQRDGKKAKRKRRHDFRCLVAGVCSWPMTMERYRALKLQDSEAWNRERLRILRWIESTNVWLQRLFGNRLAAVLLHLDEPHPHIHFVCVGDARRLHPGLRAEYVDGVRIESGRERTTRYRAAMVQFLDDYHAEVCAPLGLFRRSSVKPKQRIKDRPTALRVLELEERLRERADPAVFEELAQITADAPKPDRPEMRF
jgi:hypothetical protein